MGSGSAALDRSTLLNTMAASDWHGTHMQRMKVNFTAPANGAMTLRVAAREGRGGRRGPRRRRTSRAQRPDDRARRRRARGTLRGPSAQGWGPFDTGDAGGVADPRTHIARAAPRTRGPAGTASSSIDVIGGGEVLKSHEGERRRRLHRTSPATVPMKDGHAYQSRLRLPVQPRGRLPVDQPATTAAS
ncbi:hypothetical protein [Streptomyces sp. KL116D]|uniref:hypothetical protein n=1 Tax=Streptomyces sp. KL116D TaxID=3045152 RepID=UPI0035572D01